VTAELAATLVRGLDSAELARSFEVATRALLAEAHFIALVPGQ
jgi:hypothetical protein